MTEEEFISEYAAGLNDQQLEAVKAVSGPVLLLAVPGSGKTTVLVTRLGYMTMCCGIAPESILTLTYTVSAAADMSERFALLFGTEAAKRLEFRTINGICAGIIARCSHLLGKDAYELVSDEKETGRLLADLYTEYVHSYPNESDIRNVRTLITYCKNSMLSEQEIEKLGKKEGLPLREIRDGYNKALRSGRKMDYDDQMIYALRMLEKIPELLRFYRERYRFLCVDEAQDTSKIQHRIISLLTGDDGNLFMVGDEDQSIYGFLSWTETTDPAEA